MIEQVEALLALHKEGTMAAAANRLRVTASAISKRIAHLEEEAGYRLIEPLGREVRLTPAGLRFLEKAEPLLSGLKAALKDDPGPLAGEISIGVSEAVLASWGASVLAEAAKKAPSVRLDLNAHRSPVVIEKVRSGEYDLGICAGVTERLIDLHSELLLEEPMVIVPSGLKPMRLNSTSEWSVLTIESHASTWIGLKSALKKLEADRGVKISPVMELQSFACVVQMAKAGLVHGLAPLGIVEALGVPKGKRIKLPGVSRPVSLIARPSTLARGSVERFRDVCLKEIARVKFDS